MDDPVIPPATRAQFRFAEIREDISTRLWPINQGMSSSVFNALMDQMALLQFNCEQRGLETMVEGDRRLGDPDRRFPASVLLPKRPAMPEQPEADETPR